MGPARHAQLELAGIDLHYLLVRMLVRRQHGARLEPPQHEAHALGADEAAMEPGDHLALGQLGPENRG
jgi:hypothetical protein